MKVKYNWTCIVCGKESEAIRQKEPPKDASLDCDNCGVEVW